MVLGCVVLYVSTKVEEERIVVCVSWRSDIPGLGRPMLRFTRVVAPARRESVHFVGSTPSRIAMNWLGTHPTHGEALRVGPKVPRWGVGLGAHGPLVRVRVRVIPVS